MKKGNKTLSYEGLELPESLSNILEQDFWMLDNIGGATLAMLHLPMKFTSSTSIFVRKGHCRAEINLEQFDIEAPCLVNIASSEILQPLSISEDFQGAFVVMSSRFVDDFTSGLDDPRLLSTLRQSPVVKIPTHVLADYEFFYQHMRTLVSDQTTPYGYKALVHSMLAFFYQTVTKCIDKNASGGSTAQHITSRFLKLARQNFKKERFMSFYAEQLEITTKHLGRTIKAQTGFTASEWLDRMVILEAKVLLKSSSMSIQQIAEELNFPSQSFFGKYFKNIVGVSPKEFRNA